VGECEGMNLTHFQMNSHFGSWIPYGFLNFKKMIVRVKTHWIEKSLISLKRSWNVNVKNEVA
jgi:hypothetical protein